MAGRSLGGPPPLGAADARCARAKAPASDSPPMLTTMHGTAQVVWVWHFQTPGEKF